MASAPDASLVDRQQRRLRWAFRVAVLAASAPPAMQACAQTSAPGAPDRSADGSADSARSVDAPATLPDAGTADAPGDEDLDCSALHGPGCNTLVFADAIYVPDGSDAEICPVILPCGLPTTSKRRDAPLWTA
jgi:hypothetical protein